MFKLSEYQATLLYHPPLPAGPLPTAQDPDGVYPYESYCETASRSILQSFRMVSMENDLIRAVICPDLGGRVHSLFLKECGRETLHVSPVVRPIRILPRGAFIGGGIEVSFPISHTPVQLSPILYQTQKENARLYVRCGEQELRFGMHWTVEYSLGEEDAFLTQRTLFFNPTKQAHPWMCWSNAGVPARPDTEFHFPDGPVLYHGDEMKRIDWRTQGPRRQCDIKRMTGFFWRDPDCCAFGAFTPSLGCGLYHVADPALTPGIKLWSDGVGAHEAWVNQWTLDGKQCVEIQAGPLMDQSIKAFLQPGQRHCHVEFWLPSSRPLDILRISLPAPVLSPPGDIPLFPWARREEVDLWEALVKARLDNRPNALPQAPGIADNHWPPSGMDELGDALQWAASMTEEDDSRAWLGHLGIWHAGREDIDPAIDRLLESGDDRALALAGRLYRRCKNDACASADCFRRIQSAVFALHPQVVVERDLTLAALGPESLAERETWLGKVRALDDEWLIERRAALLIDQGRFGEAKVLLESTPFQLIHQRYTRTRLWRKIRKGLDVHEKDPANWLGEDDLAEFGAYREYQEEKETE